MDAATAWETEAPNIRPLWAVAPLSVEIPEEEVHVWSASLFHPRFDALADGETLAPDERERAAKFHFERDRRSYVVRRSVLRALLGRYLNMAPHAIRLACDERGKLSIRLTEGLTPLHFNLSHSCGLALFAVSRAFPVGVDVEKLRPIPEMADLSATICSPAELAYFKAAPAEGKLEAFFHVWTHKEAYLKATGEGITGVLTEMDCSKAPPGWTFQSLSPASGFIGALAFPRPSVRLRLWDWTTSVK